MTLIGYAILIMMKRVREECYDNESDSGLDDEEYESDGIDDCLFQTFRSY